MKKLIIVLILLLMILLLTSIIGCDGDKEATSTSSVGDFLNTNSVHMLLTEERSIFEEYSYNDSLNLQTGSPYQAIEKYTNRKCSLRERAKNNRDELLQITPPPALKDFWSMLVVAEPDCYGDMSLCGVLDMLCLCTRSCEGLEGPVSPISRLYMKVAIEKNMEAWMKLSNVCRENGVAMPWSLPVIY